MSHDSVPTQLEYGAYDEESRTHLKHRRTNGESAKYGAHATHHHHHAQSHTSVHRWKGIGCHCRYAAAAGRTRRHDGQQDNVESVFSGRHATK